MKIVRNYDRTGCGQGIYNGYKTEGGEFYFLPRKTGYGIETVMIDEKEFKRCFSKNYGQVDNLKNVLLAKKVGTSLETATQLFKEYKKQQKDHPFGKRPTYREVAEYLGVTESTVKKYPKKKRELMRLGLWMLRVLRRQI